MKQARCFKSQPQIENSGVPTSRGKIVAVVIGIIGTAHHGNKISVVRINNCMSKSLRLTHHPVALPLDLDRIQQEVAKALASPAVKERLLAQGAIPGGNSSADFVRMIDSEHRKWAQVVKAAGAKVD